MAILAAVTVLVVVAVYVYLELEEDVVGVDTALVSFELPDGDHLNISCEVADDYFERAEGLQDRKSLAQDAGMLFVYDPPQEAAFIMPNMNFPLDIVFVAENGTVLNVAEAEPEDPGTPRDDMVRYRSDGEAKWVVEINQGLSQQYGIGPGTHVDFILPLPKSPQ